MNQHEPMTGDEAFNEVGDHSLVRPDYVKCIQHTHANRKGESWCGFSRIDKLSCGMIRIHHTDRATISFMGGFSKIDQLSCGMIRVHHTDGTIEIIRKTGIYNLPSIKLDSLSLFKVLSWTQIKHNRQTTQII